jgi:hypothetical protein
MSSSLWGTTGDKLVVGDRFMPTRHAWHSLGKILEVVSETPQTRVVKVERTARSGSTRVEVFGLANDLTVLKEVGND